MSTSFDDMVQLLRTRSDIVDAVRWWTRTWEIVAFAITAAHPTKSHEVRLQAYRICLESNYFEELTQTTFFDAWSRVYYSGPRMISKYRYGKLGLSWFRWWGIKETNTAVGRRQICVCPFCKETIFQGKGLHDTNRAFDAALQEHAIQEIAALDKILCEDIKMWHDQLLGAQRLTQQLSRSAGRW